MKSDLSLFLLEICLRGSPNSAEGEGILSETDKSVGVFSVPVFIFFPFNQFPSFPCYLGQYDIIAQSTNMITPLSLPYSTWSSLWWWWKSGTTAVLFWAGEPSTGSNKTSQESGKVNISIAASSGALHALMRCYWSATAASLSIFTQPRAKVSQPSL